MQKLAFVFDTSLYVKRKKGCHDNTLLLIAIYYVLTASMQPGRRFQFDHILLSQDIRIIVVMKGNLNE